MGKLSAHFTDSDVVHLLAFIGGFVDAAGYIKIKGVFTSSITGNLVVACASVTTLNGVICRSCVSIAFAAGAGVSSMLALKLRLGLSFSLKYIALILLSLEVGMLVISWAVGIHLDRLIMASNDLDEWHVVLVGCLLGAAMGFHNVAAKESIAGCPPTTVMTSTLINVSGGLANTITLLMASVGMLRLTPPTGLKGVYLPLTAAEKHGFYTNAYDCFMKTLPLIKPLLSFLVGAIIGAITTKFGTFHCLAIPITVLVFIQIEIILNICSEEKDVQPNDCVEQQMTYTLGFSGTSVILQREVYVAPLKSDRDIENLTSNPAPESSSVKMDPIPDPVGLKIITATADESAKNV